MDFSIRNFLAGLAIVLFGMELLEDTIHDLSWASLKRRLKKLTNTPLEAIFSAFGVTALLQSSSVTSLMILAFAGAGLLTLPSAIWAIIGANVGSTILGVLVVYVGFGFKIGAFALSLAAIGWLMNKFLVSHRWKGIGKIVLSFGFMFFGISLLRDAVGWLANQIDFTQFAAIGWIGWFFIGIAVTALLHSSWAMTIIVLGLLYGWVIDFPQSMMIIAGANIGTCITAIWGAMKWSPIKKQVAASHVIFNIISWLLVLIFWRPLTLLFSHWFNFSDPKQITIWLAIFQLFYNIIGALLFYPFIRALARLLEKTFTWEKADYVLGVKWLELTDIDISIPVIQKDIIMLLKRIFRFNVHHLRIDQKTLLKSDVAFNTKLELEHVLSNDALAEDYAVIKTIEEEELTYILKALNQPNISKEVMDILQNQYNAIERMIYAAKALQDTQYSITALFQSDTVFIKDLLRELKKDMITLYLSIIPIIDNKNIEKNYKTLVQIHISQKQQHKKYLSELSNYLEKNTLEHGTLTIERSNDAIIDALTKIFLNAEQRKYIEIN
jgi:phosphate:Na+ symporter